MKNKASANSNRKSQGFATPAKSQKRYWVLECRAYEDEDGVECYEFLAVSSIYVQRCGDSHLEYREACRVLQWVMHRMPKPCNCAFLFTDELTPRPVTWQNFWAEALALHAKAQCQTRQFEPLHEEFERLRKFDPEVAAQPLNKPAEVSK